MSAAPYWGHLPDPKIVKGQPHMPGDDPMSSLDGQQLGGGGATCNRASVQTTQTEPATEASTLSPYQSPTASSFAGQGLAPRPSSYQRPIGAELAADSNARHSRRRSRGADIDQEPLSPSLPAAPEAPRGPPVSYRDPYGNGGQSNEKASDMDEEGAYVLSRDGRVASSRLPPGAMDPTRRPSVGGSERRRKSAVTKSPLQKLELTLDSMTKEEKRARLVAAERRARERAALKAAAENPHQQPVATQTTAAANGRDHPQAHAPVSRAPSQRDATAYTHAPLPREAPASQPSTHRRHQSEQNGHERSAQQPRQQFEPEQVNDVPKRNLSFRERAARNEVRFAAGDEPSPGSSPPEGFSVARSGSNKLTKRPPPEVRHQQQASVDRPVPTAAQLEPVAAQPRSKPREPTRAPQPSREKELPPDPPASDVRAPPAAAVQRGAVRGPAKEDFSAPRRVVTEPTHRRPGELEGRPSATQAKPVQRDQASQPRTTANVPSGRRVAPVYTENDYSSDGSLSPQQAPLATYSSNREPINGMKGLYQPPQWLDEWKKATVGALSGSLLNISANAVPAAPAADKNTAWWEEGGRRRSSSYATTSRRAEAFEGEYDNTNSPTRFKPPLFLECGPLLRYCGMRVDKVPSKSQRSGSTIERHMWRGSIMIVTRDSESTYDISPTLRLFVQDIELLPTPPHQVIGELSPEYMDPIAGHPKLGRRGETLYVRPADHLDEGKDLSRDETDGGLFESTRSPLDIPPPDGSADYPGSFSSRVNRIEVDGEKVQKYRDIRGFRLHKERGCTFWRFNIEVELRDKQQRIAYRINRGPSMAFWVPARGRSMNMMYYSCNGFGNSAKADQLSGPDPMWRDVLNTHQTSPFHVMIGGGNQIYNDSVAEECDLFIEWIELRDPIQKREAAFGPRLQDQVEDFYFRRYCKWFSQGLFGLANSQIPMVNMGSDREIFNGFGSFAHQDMSTPVMSGLGAAAFKYYMLFQHQSILPEDEEAEPSWILGALPGPYIREHSRSLFMSLGSKVSLLAADCRTERTVNTVIEDKTWEKILDRMYAQIKRGDLNHLLVVLPVPIAYPRLAWLENVMGSRMMNSFKRVGKSGLLGNPLKQGFDDGADVRDDLNDHWTAKNHTEERSLVIEDLQDLAMGKSLRITILSGDVNLAAVGQFYSNPKLHGALAKHNDPRYMPNVISSAIANAPPPDLIADTLNKRHKVHHLDQDTDESMIPMFQHGVNGKPRNNKRLLPHRNWCAIHEWEPGSTPPPTPPESLHEEEMENSGGLGSRIRRRLSRSKSQQRPDLSHNQSVRGPRPPVSSSGGGLFRSLSNSISRRRSTGGDRPAKLQRSPSAGHGDQNRRPSFFERFIRRGSQDVPRADDGGINGQWGSETEDDDDDYDDSQYARRTGASGLRGGAAPPYKEYSDGDEEQFSVRPHLDRRAQTWGSQSAQQEQDTDNFRPKPFHRTPTGLSKKQMRRADALEVDLEGGLDVCLNVEVNPKDPTGITRAYRLLVPKLVFEYEPEEEKPPKEPTGFKRFLSFRKKPAQQKRDEVDDGEVYSDEEDYDDAEEAGIRRQ